jgi:hypothetical protein
MAGPVYSVDVHLGTGVFIRLPRFAGMGIFSAHTAEKFAVLRSLNRMAGLVQHRGNAARGDFVMPQYVPRPGQEGFYFPAGNYSFQGFSVPYCRGGARGIRMVQSSYHISLNLMESCRTEYTLMVENLLIFSKSGTVFNF